MYNENDENRFEENQDRAQQEQETGYGSYQSHPGQYDYYDRYRQEDGGAEGRVPKKGKRKKGKAYGGRIAAAVVLAVVFVAFCVGISYLAVGSMQSQVAAVQEQAGEEGQQANGAQDGQTKGSAAQDSEDLDGDAQTPQQDSGIESAGTIQESGEVTAVVTDVTDVVEKVMPACVSITNNFTEQVQDFWGQIYSQDEEASGSGIIIGENDSELLIVTNNHVVDSADTIHVQFIDGENVEAQIKGTDPAVDLAIIAVNLDDIPFSTREEIRIAQMGDSDALKIGEPAIAIGNALGYGQSVTTGVISALNRTLEVSETGSSNALIQTDAAINPGNSGGALLNINGEVIGINSSKIGGNVVEGMGYAIPISTARPIIEELMQRETKSRVSAEERGYLGISCINVTSDLSETFGMPEGIFVAQVYEGTGADRAGLVRGDIITAFAGTTVRNQDELTRQMEYYKAGETVEITIMQGSPTGYQPKNVEITLSSYDELNEGSQRAQDQGRRP